MLLTWIMVLEELGNASPSTLPQYWVVLKAEKEMLINYPELYFQHNGSVYYYIFHKECSVVLGHNG